MIKFKIIRILKRCNLLIGFNKKVETQDSDYLYNNFRPEVSDENYESEFKLIGDGYSASFWPYEMIMKPNFLFGFISIYGSIFFTRNNSILKIRIKLTNFMHAIYIVLLQIGVIIFISAKSSRIIDSIPFDLSKIIFLFILLSIPSFPILLYFSAGLSIKKEYQKFIFRFNEKLI